MNDIVAFERSNDRKGMGFSFFIHALILLIAFFYAIPGHIQEDPPVVPPPYAVRMDISFEENIPKSPPVTEPKDVEFNNEETSQGKLSHDDEGAQREKSESAPAPTTTKTNPTSQPAEIKNNEPKVLGSPKPVIKIPSPVPSPKSSDPDIISSSAEDTKVKVPERPTSGGGTTKPSVPTRPTTGGATGTPGTSTGKPNSTTTGSTTGTSTSKPSSIDGVPGGTGKGKTGTGAGSDAGNDGDGGLGNSSDGTGEYDGTGDGTIFGRKVIYRDVSAAKAAFNVSGIVSIKICVNRGGAVTYTEINNAETTIKDRYTLKKYMTAARNYKVQPDLKAPKEQCGKLNFKLDNSINNKLRK